MLLHPYFNNATPWVLVVSVGGGGGGGCWSPDLLPSFLFFGVSVDVVAAGSTIGVVSLVSVIEGGGCVTRLVFGIGGAVGLVSVTNGAFAVGVLRVRGRGVIPGVPAG